MQLHKTSEKILTLAIKDVHKYASDKFKQIGGEVIHKKKFSLGNCSRYYQYAGGEPTYFSHKYFIKPDGGILFARIKNRDIPILITEDKTQGTNDIYYHLSNNKNQYIKQSVGNAFERTAKNKNAAQMIFAGVNYFPYAVFASGCDFHSSETIGSRAVAMNWCQSNHYVDISDKTTKKHVYNDIENIINNINIQKRRNGKDCVASIFIKGHNYMNMQHGSSMWEHKEIVKICNNMIDKVYDEIKKMTNQQYKNIPPVII